MKPTISIVVTCHEYGHFLRACLASVFSQTRPVDQVIVVDDGSSDDSAAVARSFGGRLVVIEQANQGQASAFNAGFAAATGEIVIFLDADDTLEADAAELLQTAWHDDFAAIGFRLNIIDETGRLAGFYPVDPLGGDMLPELLERGHFRFMPTSGNAFNRSRIGTAFPLPTQRWRISADAVLLRAAALAGPIGQLPMALGNYRIHRGNSYHRVSQPRLEQARRAYRDMSDSCRAAASLDTLPGERIASDENAVRLELLLASARMRAALSRTGKDPASPARYIAANLTQASRLRLGWRARAGLAGLALTALVAGASKRVQCWIMNAADRPHAVQVLVASALGSSLVARRRAARRQSPPAGRVGHVPIDGDAGMLAGLNRYDWLTKDQGDARVLRGSRGEIAIPAAVLPDGGRLTLTIRAIDLFAGVPIDLDLTHGADVLASTTMDGEASLSVDLDPALASHGEPILLHLVATARPRNLRERWAWFLRPTGYIECLSLSMSAFAPLKTGVLLGIGEIYAFADIARACVVNPEQRDSTERTERIGARQIGLVFTRPVHGEPTELVLTFSDDQIAGVLTVGCEAGNLFLGGIGPRAVVRAPLPPREADDAELTLTLDFDPEDIFGAAEFRLATISLTVPTSELDVTDRSFPVIVPGQVVTFEVDTTALTWLGEGWHLGEGGADLLDTLGVIRFTVDSSVGETAILHLRIEPTTPLAPGAFLAVSVSAADKALANVLLQGEHELAVPLDFLLENGQRQATLAIHAAATGTSLPDGELQRGALTLGGMVLSAPAISVARTPSKPARSSLVATVIEEAGELAGRLLASPRPVAADKWQRLRRLRDDIVVMLDRLASGAIEPLLLRPSTLEHLVAIGQATALAGTVDDLPCRGKAAIWGGDRPEAIKAMAIAVLSSAPWDVFEAGNTLSALTRYAQVSAPALARYLCQSNHPVSTPEDIDSYRRYVEMLLDHARDRLARGAAGSPDYDLAVQLVRSVHLMPLLGSGAPLRNAARALGRGIESYLVSRGRRITLARAPRPVAARLRVGVLVNDFRAAPETWILAGTVGALATSEFEVFVFALKSDCRPPSKLADLATVVFLDGMGTDRAVDIIRAADLDVFLLGVFFQSYGDVAPIVAHRLAPVQLATSAISPMTTGLGSFDIMISAKVCEPEDAQAHYVERLHLADLPIQRFDFGDADGDVRAGRALVRARLGISDDTIVLTSGAAQPKLNRRLLEAWVEILGTAPDAVLVIYPFAANWKLRFHARQRLDEMLSAICKERGVDAGRIHILDPIPSEQVSDLLGASDIYLDSFPYAGATTVVEALRTGLPAVALAGDCQRGMQGAMWVREGGLPDLVASTVAEYVGIASRLATDEGARARARQTIRRPIVEEETQFGRRYGDLLWELSGVTREETGEPRWLFHHLPKGVGTTTRAILGHWFNVHDDDRKPWSRARAPAPLDLAAINRNDIVCGHFNSPGYYLHQRYPSILRDPGWRMITILRDPLETAISYYFFERHHRPKVDRRFRPMTLNAYLESAPCHLLDHLRSIDADWRTALDRYWFVGVSDRFDACMEWLAKALDKPMPDEAIWLNQTARDETPSHEAVRLFVERSAVEFEIFRVATDRCNAILATDPADYRRPPG
jgi:glycosyltransferase involved in cell wall biosynthesis